MIFYCRCDEEHPEIISDQARENLRWCQDTINSIDLEKPLQACERTELQTKLAQLQYFAATMDAEHKHVPEIRKEIEAAQQVKKENVEESSAQFQQAPLKESGQAKGTKDPQVALKESGETKGTTDLQVSLKESGQAKGTKNPQVTLKESGKTK